MFEDIGTPSFLVDREIVRRNCERMSARARSGGVMLRPHVKTHKTIEGARMQLGAPTGPITVSTLAEAEYFANEGFRDLTWAVPLEISKLGRAAALASRVDRLNLLVDHPDAVAAMEEFARSGRATFDVFLKVDCGAHRAGVDPHSREAVQLASRIASSEVLRFRGLLTHAGHAYHARSVDEIRSIATEESETLTRLAEALLEAGVRVETRSIGSTPTCSVVDSLPPIEEARPGNYVFYDAFQARLGSCELEDCAASVLSSVIGIYPSRRSALIDAGALAMSKDRGAEDLGGPRGYGVVCDLAGRPLAGVHLVGLSQEHGELEIDPQRDMAGLAIGTRVRIVPNHSCLTAALFDRYVVVERGEIIDQWKPARGW